MPLLDSMKHLGSCMRRSSGVETIACLNRDSADNPDGCGVNPVVRNAEGDGYDGGFVTSRCSVRILHEVITCFDDRKRDLVKSIGFGGILSLPFLPKINRKFSTWLMKNVDEVEKAIVISENMKLIAAEGGCWLDFWYPIFL